MKKQQSKRIDDALSKALAPPKRRPSPTLNDLLSQYATQEASAPEQPLEAVAQEQQPLPSLNLTPPAQLATPAYTAAEPRHDAAPAQHTTPAPRAGVAHVAGYTKVANELLDRILPTLDVYDQVVMIRLWRLSRGFNSDTCRVSQPTLSKSCNISERQLRLTIGRLEARGLISRVERDFDNKNFAQRGTVFKMHVEGASPAQHATQAPRAAPVHYAAQAPRASIKETHVKETHTNTEAVRVGSYFSLTECRKYAEHLRSTGQGINNPGGYATKVHRSGEADELIKSFLESGRGGKAVDARKCPDCNGTGFYYPKGPSEGVVKCKHEGLVSSSVENQ